MTPRLPVHHIVFIFLFQPIFGGFVFQNIWGNLMNIKHNKKKQIGIVIWRFTAPVMAVVKKNKK